MEDEEAEASALLGTHGDDDHALDHFDDDDGGGGAGAAAAAPHGKRRLRVTAALSPLEQALLWCNGALAVVGLLEFAVGFFLGAHGFVGSYAAYALGALGLLVAALAALTCMALLRLHSHADRSTAALQWAAHAGALLALCLLVFGVGVLSVSRLFWESAALQWSDVRHHYYPAGPDEARATVERTILTVGVLAILSALGLAASVVGSFVVAALSPLTDQAFLWSHFAIGVWGATLVGGAAYLLPHRGSVPVSVQEAGVLLAVGLALFAVAVAGLWRLHMWPQRSPQQWAAAHTGALVVAAVFLASLSSVFLYRSTHADDYLHHRPPNDFARFGALSIWGSGSVAKLALSARIQLVLLGLATLVAALSTAVAGVFALFLDPILLTQIRRGVGFHIATLPADESSGHRSAK